MPQPSATPQPIDKTLTVSFDGTNFTVTGGDDGAGDVNVPHVKNNRITFTRKAGENWHFWNFKLQATMNNGQNLQMFSKFRIDTNLETIVVQDDDTNSSGQDRSYKYTIVINDNGTMRELDPMIVNKAGGND